MTEHNSPILEVHDLSFGYQSGQAVLSGLTASLWPGQVCALIGPNAAGKSTLLRIMLGQIAPWTGSVALAGRDVNDWPAARRAALVSYVPQRGGAHFGFGVDEVVRMGRYALPRDEAAVDHAIERCDLAALRTRIYSELSVGQQQRVLLARALAQAQGQGKVILLDEPGSAMDLWHSHRTMSILRNLGGSGMAVLVVVHDLNLAAQYADTVWLLHKGRLAQAGRWQDVLTPAILEPVYRVKLDPVPAPGSGRPMFRVDQSGLAETAVATAEAVTAANAETIGKDVPWRR
ncbi:MAG: ATP-binding cassette domain-containing protein [Phycisphaeraceae bacterium]